ncbi:MAG: substrate-binding domain-containing protein [Nevskia sp.]|nr:substrate-binding domain-containing protein [Nevskia sp.]
MSSPSPFRRFLSGLTPGGRTLASLALAFCLILAAVGSCGRSAPPRGGGQQNGDELVIIASNGLKDMEFLHQPMEAAIGRKIRFDYVGTVEMADRLRESGASAADLAWPASGFYLRLNAGPKIIASEKIMQSPVVFALKKPRAEDLGWDQKSPTWDEIALVAGRDNLALGMTSPVVSDLGLAALFSAGLATANTSPVELADLNLPELKQLYSGTRLIGGSAHWLADAYVKQENRLDGMINYESIVLNLDAGSQLGTPLAVIHPRDGSVMADYPLMLINPLHRNEYTRLLAFLRSPAVQQQIVDRTWRRPVVPGVRLPKALEARLPRSLPEPARPGFVDAVLDLYQTQVRVAAHSYFVLDISGSMAQEHRMDDLKAALHLLSGSDQSTLAGRYARFLPRERVDLSTFNSHVVDHLGVDFASPQGYDKTRGRFEDFVNGLQPSGGTAIYDALQATYQQALKDRKQQPGYYPSIVLMTDGESSSGSDFEAFRNWYQALPDTAQDIPVFTILFGEADSDEMKSLAELTGGRVFDATNSSLSAVFKEIRGYQ